MYYFSEVTIKSSFDALKENVENKFLGVLGILKCISDDIIKPNITYQIVDGELARWLDEVCYLNDYDGNYGTSSLYVKFSNNWSQYVGSEFFKKSVNIFNLIVFLYKYEGFIYKPRNIELIAKFCKDYHLSRDIVQDWFDCTSIAISYSEHVESKSKCKALLGMSNDTISLATPFSVAARAGELSRAPFIQTLYAGMDSIKCLLILRDNIDGYYSPVELYKGRENLVRDSFIRFWEITEPSNKDPGKYVREYENAINDLLQQYASVKNVFSITDISQYEKTIGTIIEKNNDFAYLKEQTDQDRTITNTKARVWGAHKCYLKFLRVLAATNCLKVSSRALNIQSKEKSECLSYLTALRTKPFMLLAGISGTGKSRIVRKLAQATVTKELQAIEGYTGTNFEEDRWTLHRPANFELIQVKPNWHNSMDVVGYLSNIPTPHYVFTPFAELIAKAWQHEDIPFFLCLDEMNLAPVEEYFAEFLSAIESRSFEGGEYVTDPIIKPFKSFGKSVCADMINALLPDIDASSATEEIVKLKNQFTEKGLTLPKNLIVIGTVNMDETTFSFSRKVLDRAMSVEMNEVDYDSFLSGNTDDEIKAMVEHFGEVKLNSLLVDRRIEAKEVKDDLGPDAQKVVDYLKRINALLEGTPFKLGYRAANEALIYLRAAQEFGNPDYVAALDNFTLMKILSRIEGDENKLKITDSAADKERLELSGVKVEQPGDLNVLTALRSLISQQLGEFYKAGEEPASSEEPLTEAEMEAEPEAAQETESEDNAPQETEKKQGELKSIKKIDNMLSQLKRDHFVSYWN
jgi:5-methylcytosine-specific restriction enzyme B